MVDLNSPGFVVGINSWFHTFHAAGLVWVHLLPQIAWRMLHQLGYEVVSRVETPKAFQNSPKYHNFLFLKNMQNKWGIPHFSKWFAVPWALDMGAERTLMASLQKTGS